MNEFKTQNQDGLYTPCLELSIAWSQQTLLNKAL